MEYSSYPFFSSPFGYFLPKEKKRIEKKGNKTTSPKGI
jgi:hypothetical protein